jgi:hypothetical protein
MVVIQPKGSSIRFRMRWLTSCPTWRVVRPSMVLRWRVVLGSKCGVNPRSRTSATKPCGVVALVAGDGAAPCPRWRPAEHLERGVTFRETGRFGEFHVDDQCVAVLHEQMPGVAELGGGGVGLAGQPRLRVGGGLVRLVGAPLPVVVDLGVPSWR